MRQRWVIVVLVAVVCCLPVLRSLSRTALGRAGDAPLRPAQRVLGERVTVGWLAARLRSVYLRDAAHQDEHLAVQAAGIRAWSSLWRLLTSRLDAAEPVDGVRAERPEVGFQANRLQDTVETARAWWPLALPSHPRVTLSGGRLTMERARGPDARLAAPLGEMALREDEHAPGVRARAQRPHSEEDRPIRVLRYPSS